MQRTNAIKVIKYIPFLFIMLFMVYRLFRGCDVTDEVYYISMANRYTKGDIPILTSWDSQFGSFLFTPLIYLYKGLNGNLEGIVLFFRFCYLVLSCIANTISGKLLSRKISNNASYFIVLPLLCAVPFSIPTLSYNTVPCLFILIAQSLICVIDTYEGRRQISYAFLIGFLYAMACFLYPTIVFLAVINVIFIYMKIKSKVAKTRIYGIVMSYIAGGVLPVVIFLAFLIYKGNGIKPFIEGVWQILNSPHELSKGEINRDFWIQTCLMPIKTYLKSNVFIMTLSISIINLIIYVKAKSNIKYIIQFALLFFVSLFITNINEMWVLLWLQLLVMLFVKTKLADIKEHVTVFILPAITLLFIYVCSSNNRNIFFGMFMSFLIIPSLMSIITGKMAGARSDKHTILILSAILCAIFLKYFYGYVYRDEPVNQLKAKVETGIFKGMYTTPERDKGLMHLEDVLKEHIDGDKTLCVGVSFPAPYIMTDAELCTPSMWDLQYLSEGFTSARPILDYFQMRKKLPDYIIIENSRISGLLNNPDYQINLLLDKYYNLIVSDEKGYYPIYIYVLNGKREG